MHYVLCYLLVHQLYVTSMHISLRILLSFMITCHFVLSNCRFHDVSESKSRDPRQFALSFLVAQSRPLNLDLQDLCLLAQIRVPRTNNAASASLSSPGWLGVSDSKER